MPQPDKTRLRTLRDRYAAWWLADYPPLDGRLRLLVYGGLLALTVYHPRSPLQGIFSYAQTDPVLFRRFGLIEWLGIPGLPPRAVAIAVGITGIAWSATAIGLFTRPTSVLTAVGTFLLHGYFWGSNAFNHNWYLTIYVLGALCFAGADPRWSADAWLARRLGRVPPLRRGVGDTGFARKLALVCTVTFYFSAGITKLTTAGLAWMDGHTISYWGGLRGAEFDHSLGVYLASNLQLSGVLSVLTICLEVGAPLVLVFPRLLWLFIPGWIGLHIGIRLTMGPRYFENMVCFLLIVHWETLRVHWEKFRRSAGAATQRPPAQRTLGWSERAAIWVGTLGLAAALAVSAVQINWWPLTHVYMYSSYYSVPREIRAGDPRAAYLDAASVQGIARRFRDAPPSFDEMEHLPVHARLWLTGDGIERRQLYALGVATPKQWDLVIELPVLVDDLTTKPPGRIAYDPAAGETNAMRFLAGLVPVVHRRVPEWERYRRLELTYRLRDGDVTLASVPLRPIP